MAEVQPDPTVFENRYPTLQELLRDGGLTGVEYCLVSGANQRLFGGDADPDGNTWSAVRDLPILTIKGPKGTVDTVVLMGRGNPVPGAGDYNGIRHYWVDVTLEEAVGIPANPQSPVATSISNKPDLPKPTPKPAKEPASAPKERSEP
jgi:hypothetical protein